MQMQLADRGKHQGVRPGLLDVLCKAISVLCNNCKNSFARVSVTIRRHI